MERVEFCDTMSQHGRPTDEQLDALYWQLVMELQESSLLCCMAKDKELCIKWLTIFEKTSEQEKNARNSLMTLLQRQLATSGTLKYPFTVLHNCNRDLNVVYKEYLKDVGRQHRIWKNKQAMERNAGGCTLTNDAVYATSYLETEIEEFIQLPARPYNREDFKTKVKLSAIPELKSSPLSSPIIQTIQTVREPNNNNNNNNNNTRPELSNKLEQELRTLQELRSMTDFARQHYRQSSCRARKSAAEVPILDTSLPARTNKKLKKTTTTSLSAHSKNNVCQKVITRKSYENGKSSTRSLPCSITGTPKDKKLVATTTTTTSRKHFCEHLKPERSTKKSTTTTTPPRTRTTLPAALRVPRPSQTCLDKPMPPPEQVPDNCAQKLTATASAKVELAKMISKLREQNIALHLEVNKLRKQTKDKHVETVKLNTNMIQRRYERIEFECLISALKKHLLENCEKLIAEMEFALLRQKKEFTMAKRKLNTMKANDYFSVLPDNNYEQIFDSVSCPIDSLLIGNVNVDVKQPKVDNVATAVDKHKAKPEENMLPSGIFRTLLASLAKLTPSKLLPGEERLNQYHYEFALLDARFDAALHKRFDEFYEKRKASLTVKLTEMYECMHHELKMRFGKGIELSAQTPPSDQEYLQTYCIQKLRKILNEVYTKDQAHIWQMFNEIEKQYKKSLERIEKSK